METELFSDKLQKWLKSTRPKTVESLNQTFLEKTHAVALLVLLMPSALPIPTGGVTNALEIIAMIISLQLIIGRRTVWIPKRWQKTEIGKFGKSRAIPLTIKLISKMEHIPRFPINILTTRRYILSIIGVFLLVFTLGAFFAPPFSGLDTLPSLGVVLLSLAIIIENGYLLIMGAIAGSIGMFISFSVWSYFVNLLITF